MATPWISLLAVLILSGPINGLQCKDDYNNSVDWYIIYKIPPTRSLRPQAREGTAYVYVTSTARNISWTLSEKDVAREDSALGNTLSPLYNDNVAASSMWVIYNDQPPGVDNPYMYKSHTKGVVMLNEKQGFWMIHSVPRFPALPRTGTSGGRASEPGGRYHYPDSGKKYGQMFLCISVTANQVDLISRQLMYTEIIANRKNWPLHLMNLSPDFMKVLNRKRLDSQPETSIAEITSTNGHKFYSLAASRAWKGELWSDLVSPTLETSLFVMSLRKANGLPSKCSGNFTVENIEEIGIHEFKFRSFNNNAKWAISPGGNWFCIGDLNRVGRQLARAGGAVCTRSRIIIQIFRRMIRAIEKCP